MAAYPEKPIKGRGTAQKLPGRFATRVVELDPADPPDDTDVRRAPTTELRLDATRSIVSTNQSPDLPFERSINPYRGCEHGCIYCYARPSHSYLELSPGIDFESIIFYKSKAPELLRKYLSRPGYRCQPIVIGANTDPYQPAERDLGITRQLLEVCSEFCQPVSIITKGSTIERDVDLIAPLARRNLCHVAVSLPTLDAELKRVLEPRVPSPGRRLRVIERLATAGVPVSLMLAPVIPALTDNEIERIVKQAAGAGATSARYILLRLPHEVRPLFEQWLSDHYPQRAAHVLSVLNSLHGGKTYDARFGVRQRGQGPFAELLRQRFETSCRRYGLSTSRDSPLTTELFREPGRGRQGCFEF